MRSEPMDLRTDEDTFEEFEKKNESKSESKSSTEAERKTDGWTDTKQDPSEWAQAVMQKPFICAKKAKLD